MDEALASLLFTLNALSVTHRGAAAAGACSIPSHVTPQFRLLRVEGTRAESRAISIDLFKTLDDAVAAAAVQPRQPVGASWEAGTVVGVWSQLDQSGQGFVVHRIGLAP